MIRVGSRNLTGTGIKKNNMENNEENEVVEFFLDLKDFLITQSNILNGEKILVDLRLKEAVENPPTSFSDMHRKMELLKSVIYDSGVIQGKLEFMNDFGDFLDKQTEKTR